MGKKPVIVMVIPDLKGNGAERVLLTLATGFSQQNCDVNIVVFNDFIELKSDQSFKLHVFNKHYRWIPKAIRGIVLAPMLDKYIIKTCGVPDLVLSNLMPVDRILCQSRLKNTFLVLHNTIGQEFLKGLSASKKQRLIKKLAIIYTKKPTISVSKGVKEDFDAVFDSRFDSHQIYNPIDFELIKKLSTEYKPTISGYLVHVGKFKHQKRHDILIRAYHHSKVQKPLVLVGQGPLKKECQELVNDLELNNRVIFAGFKSNPYPYIKNADLMILSSEYEGLGLVILESLALETPVISTDCASGPREILPEINLANVNNVEELSKKISDATNNMDKYFSNISRDFFLEASTSQYLNLIKQ